MLNKKNSKPKTSKPKTLNQKTSNKKTSDQKTVNQKTLNNTHEYEILDSENAKNLVHAKLCRVKTF